MCHSFRLISNRGLALAMHPPTRGLPRTGIVPPRKFRRKVVWISLADEKRGFERVLWV